MNERLLDIRHLSVSFDTAQGRVHALRDVSFHVNRGEILGLVGESGSGKSVSMLSCLGLLARNGQIEHGSILFDGQELSPVGLTGRGELRKHEVLLRSIRGNRIGMIFQDPMTYLNPVLTHHRDTADGGPGSPRKVQPAGSMAARCRDAAQGRHLQSRAAHAAVSL